MATAAQVATQYIAQTRNGSVIQTALDAGGNVNFRWCPADIVGTASTAYGWQRLNGGDLREFCRTIDATVSTSAVLAALAGEPTISAVVVPNVNPVPGSVYVDLNTGAVTGAFAAGAAVRN